MDFEARKQKALAIMASRKMWKSNYSPPLIRLLWRLGINIPRCRLPHSGWFFA
ncbi:Uncharacterised protein [Klebsiella pneumoniae]|uniref:Uncharacterized protein n=2 Tax=Klebsiella pneumoniae TaxID=573 RepID=A0A377YX40_KLEPO|nr:Uncharacterised protein [Serratia marcescens]CDQ53925.1 unnamed protein product [Klebsiella pneumoniae]STU54913.1 Uncharacterised protein [Klebsiella pneumoniae subsp. ozaenae]VFS24673.1 Uncharacterised protein [Serratia liquefaciens]SPX46098.1 Uncharacterised protein [Klebsiella pneumoniae]